MPNIRHTHPPSALLIKAVLLGGAAAMTGIATQIPTLLTPPPSPFQGFGRVDLSRSLPLNGSLGWGMQVSVRFQEPKLILGICSCRHPMHFCLHAPHAQPTHFAHVSSCLRTPCTQLLHFLCTISHFLMRFTCQCYILPSETYQKPIEDKHISGGKIVKIAAQLLGKIV